MGTVSVDLSSGEVVRQRGYSTFRWIGGIAFFIVAIGILAFVLHTRTRMNVQDLFVDPAAKAEFGPHVGVFSHLGVLALWTGATATIGSALMMRRLGGGGKGATGHLITIGALMAWLAIDDLSVLHEELGWVIRRTLSPNSDQRLLEGLVFVVYGLAWLFCLIWHRRRILRGPAEVLVLALFCLGASAGVDLGEVWITERVWVYVSHDQTTAVTVMEELLKLAGMLLLAKYAVSIAAEHAHPGHRIPSGDSTGERISWIHNGTR